MAESFDERAAARPWMLVRSSLWHLPLPDNSLLRYGMHPSLRIGSGDELYLVRKLEPYDDYQFYSPQLSAEMGEPWGAFFLSHGIIKVVIVVDLKESMNFGVPPKRHVASKIAASLAMLATGSANEGEVAFVVLGEKMYSGEPISSFAHAYGEIKMLLSAIPRSSRDIPLGKTLKRIVTAHEDSLILVISDFLIDPASEEEWGLLSQARSLAQEARNEVAYIRVIDSLESDFPKGGSVTVDGTESAVWSNQETGKHVRGINTLIRDRISNIAGGSPGTRFVECTWRQHGEEGMKVRDVLKRFIQKRDNMIRGHIGALA